MSSLIKFKYRFHCINTCEAESHTSQLRNSVIIHAIMSITYNIPEYAQHMTAASKFVLWNDSHTLTIIVKKSLQFQIKLHITI